MNVAVALLALALAAAARRPGPRRPVIHDTVATQPPTIEAHHALDAAARSVRAGQAPRRAVADRVPPSLRADPLVDQACASALAGGADPARVLERAAATLRERDALRQEQRVHTTQARLSARVMTAVPLAFAALTAWSNHDVRAAYGTPFGAAAVIAGLTSNLLGWWWMRRIVERSW